MDYQYENLSPERFQHFCQALLALELPDVQCFPVAQPDGGRDAISRQFAQGGNAEFVIYQIKYRRRPHADKNPHKWVIETLEKELPKVRPLIPKGAKRFYLLTNVSGTAHPKAGSIDQVQHLLDESLDIPAACWWRDDLNRRLDGSFDLKWSYPELLSGVDMLRVLVEMGVSEHGERRAAAIRAFLSAQYGMDRDVRFKQVELQNRLLDLFVDIPLAIPAREARDRTESPEFQVLRQLGMQLRPSDGNASESFDSSEPGPHTWPGHSHPWPGAAAALLHPVLQKVLPKVVVEGAPGQGKSTIGQYICQVHRMRLLRPSPSIEEELQLIPDQLKQTPIRLPFRVELRDYAMWLDKKNPFSGIENDTVPPAWNKSLESFLSAQVAHHSGGIEFSVSDLHAVAMVSPLLLLLDGLDEVADIRRRKAVVDEITKATDRLGESASSLQVVVTSRPAAFANSPGLPRRDFPHCELADVSPEMIIKYAKKWLNARHLVESEHEGFLNVLRQKLGQPHLRDLARNPMQLAILLSLLHTRGASLPDKRTALYDAYIELFFNREAEKSTVVRDHRDLLIDIHRHLAWVLHSEAEIRGQGSITSARLLSVVRDYLTAEHRNPALADDLFAGMVERVVALVSRVEGTFEFEVQPLREYFAARHLYETAPYSPPGAERRGTKPDRFDAIARNSYWLNVTRFYAGCFSKGELPSLADKIEELAVDPSLSETSQPSVLATTLLCDWVFAQHPRSVEKVARLICDDSRLRLSWLRGAGLTGPRAELALPASNGREELAARCWERLEAGVAPELAQEAATSVRFNSDPGERTERWLQATAKASGAERTRWFEHGAAMNAIRGVERDQIVPLLEDAPLDLQRLRLLHESGLRDFCVDDLARCETLARGVLDGAEDARFSLEGDSPVSRLELALLPWRYQMALQDPKPIPLGDLFERRFRFATMSQPDAQRSLPTNAVARMCDEVADVADEECKQDARKWATSLASWDAVVETCRRNWGESWATYKLANLAAGIRSQEEKCADHPDLHDDQKSLCRRARYARLKSGSARFWVDQLAQDVGEPRRGFSLLLLLTWGTEVTLGKVLEELSVCVNGLSDQAWQKLAWSLRWEHRFTSKRTLRSLEPRPSDSSRIATLMGIRASEKHARVLYRKYLATYKGEDLQILSFCALHQIIRAVADRAEWKQALRLSEKCHRLGAGSRPWARGIEDLRNMPSDVASSVVANPNIYPRYLLALAEAKCSTQVRSKARRVGEIAEAEGWFSDDG